jgi:hypothetical protein
MNHPDYGKQPLPLKIAKNPLIDIRVFKPQPPFWRDSKYVYIAAPSPLRYVVSIRGLENFLLLNSRI